MKQLISITILFAVSCVGPGCHSACRHMEKENGKLVTGKETFGVKKHSKYKRMNRKGA